MASLAELREAAPTASNYKVCRGVIVGRGDLYIAAHEEQQHRALDCGPYVQAVMDEQRQQQGGIDPVQAMQMLNSMQPYRPYQAPPPPPVNTGTVNCTSQAVGTSTQTTCR